MKKIILICSLIVFASCETSLNYKEYITNNTQNDVWIVLDSIPSIRASFLNKDSVLVKSGETILFFEHNELNGLTSEFEDCENFWAYEVDSTMILKTDANPAKKSYEINNPHAWRFEIIKNDDCQCIFEIKEEMFN